MNQACLSLDLDLDLQIRTAPDGSELDRIGFDVGWDHAQHGLVPPPELLLDGTPVGQGWRAGKAVFGQRTLTTQRHTRQWLALRTLAWRKGLSFETQAVTAHYLAQIHVDNCPVTRRCLGGAPGQTDAAVVERLNPDAGYAAGNLAVLSQAAAAARQGQGVFDLVRRAHHALHAHPADPAQTAQQAIAGFDAACWWRLAALQSYSTPLPFHQAARMPLAVMPPNRVRLLNAPQGLQALLTRQFTQPGWAARTRSMAQLLPAHSLRHDFNLFIGSMAPRVLEAVSAERNISHALEDAWLSERVQRRWTHLVMSMGEAATSSLLDRAADIGLTGVVTLNLPAAQATDGWALARRGQLPRVSWAEPLSRPRAGQAASPQTLMA